MITFTALLTTEKSHLARLTVSARTVGNSHSEPKGSEKMRLASGNGWNCCLVQLVMAAFTPQYQDLVAVKTSDSPVDHGIQQPWWSTFFTHVNNIIGEGLV